MIEDLIHSHIAAFNDRDLDATLACFTDDAHWVTGRSTAHGREELTELFAGAFQALLPTLKLQTLIVGDGLAAAQMVEEYSHDGKEYTDHIAGFFVVRDGRIAAAKIYREGSAEVG